MIEACLKRCCRTMKLALTTWARHPLLSAPVTVLQYLVDVRKARPLAVIHYNTAAVVPRGFRASHHTLAVLFELDQSLNNGE